MRLLGRVIVNVPISASLLIEYFFISTNQSHQCYQRGYLVNVTIVRKLKFALLVSAMLECTLQFAIIYRMPLPTNILFVPEINFWCDQEKPLRLAQLVTVRGLLLKAR